MSNFIDFHVHIDYYKDYLKIYEQYNTEKIYALFVTNFPEVYLRAKSHFPTSKYVKIALGFHPENALVRNFNSKLFYELIKDTKYVGEVGLDFSSKFLASKDKQIEIFNQIAKISGQTNKILSVHSRKAEKEVLQVLQNNNVKFAVFHWYSGEVSLIEEIANAGYYFSINPSMLRSKHGREIIHKVPKSRLLIESDGPFGKLNSQLIEPILIKDVYNAFEKEMGVENLKDLVYRNLEVLLKNQLHGR